MNELCFSKTARPNLLGYLAEFARSGPPVLRSPCLMNLCLYTHDERWFLINRGGAYKIAIE